MPLIVHVCTEVLFCCINGMKHYLFAVAFASFGGDNPADGYFLHVSTCWTYTSQGYNLIGNGEPQVNGIPVISIHILIDTILLNHEYPATYSQEFVEFIHRQLLE